MEGGASFANGQETASQPNPRKAMVVFLTEVDGQYILNIAPGDHTCERWIITRESLRAITLMGIKKLI